MMVQLGLFLLLTLDLSQSWSTSSDMFTTFRITCLSSTKVCLIYDLFSSVSSSLLMRSFGSTTIWELLRIWSLRSPEILWKYSDYFAFGLFSDKTFDLWLKPLFWLGCFLLIFCDSPLLFSSSEASESGFKPSTLMHPEFRPKLLGSTFIN